MANLSVLKKKASNIERCVKRIQQKCENKPSLLTDLDLQDIVILNLHRACQAAIDAGMHIIKVRALGLPDANKDVFATLQRANIISMDLSQKLQKMAGFRNIAVHEYTEIDLAIVGKIVEEHLDDLLAFSRIIFALELSE